jgi:pentose-5-phosphate-3-epimerase
MHYWFIGKGNCSLHRTVQHVKALGKRVGVVINPATPALVLEDILQVVDQVLVMTVNPGFGNRNSHGLAEDPSTPAND